VRVLVVDDYAPFRQFVCSMLKGKAGLEVVGEAAHGLEAIRKAEELRPDLVILDLALPGLNGIQVARRLRQLFCECKIVVVTQESSAEVVQETLRVGALGYVLKVHAGSELLLAIDAVCQDRQFLGKGL
jgi:DNA-binding NarL/FixJ family response regulator